MNFFNSVFSDDPQPSDSPNPQQQPDNPNPNPSSNSAWTFNTLIKTLATKSESAIETYRRDIKELGSGLKKETAVIRQAASTSLEKGASVAQESLESVGQAVDDISFSVWKSTAVIISRGKNTLLSRPSDHELDYPSHNNSNRNNNKKLSMNRYSRFEMQLRAVQCDESTYCVGPEDKEEFEKWRLGFVFDEKEKEKEIENLISENGVIADIYRDVVPSRVVDGETFWTRYFYRVYKLKEAEDARAKLVKRAISGEEEKDLSWDFDDDDDEEETNGSLLNPQTSENNARNDDKLEERDDGNVVVEGKEDNGELSCKDSDVSIVSSQPSMTEVEDLGWDEIEETGSNDEIKGEVVGSTSRADLQKRLSAAEEEEDLSWDIEDEDEPGKP